MSATSMLEPRSFPGRIADLGFTADLPVGWIVHDLPEDRADFSDPTTMVPLALVSAPHAAIFFVFAARPAYDDGTLRDWANYLVSHNQLEPRALGEGDVSGVPAVVGEGTQHAEVGPILVRFAFFEDGDRLVNVTLTAPELLGDAVEDAWFGLLRSFQLSASRGSRFTNATARMEDA